MTSDLKFEAREAWIHLEATGFQGQVPVECRECGARELAFTAVDSDAYLVCSGGHTTRDTRLTAAVMRAAVPQAAAGNTLDEVVFHVSADN